MVLLNQPVHGDAGIHRILGHVALSRSGRITMLLSIEERSRRPPLECADHFRFQLSNRQLCHWLSLQRGVFIAIVRSSALRLPNKT